tara:strand:- start:4063 stop:4905 length:843 start_codon:yes stop_codon:yes gene_type:complete
MKVDIILCAHNAERTIKDCISSLVVQTHKDINIHVFDDASTDNTLEILRKYRDTRVNIVSSKKNIGTYAGKNFIYKNFCAGSDYIALQDADDYSHPRRIEIQSKFLKDNDIVCAGTGIVEFWEQGSLPWTKHSGEWIGNSRENYYPELIENKDLEEVLSYLQDNENYQRYLKFKFCMNGSVMFETEFLKSIGGWDGEARVAADTDIFIRTLANNNICNIQRCLYYRRFHKNSLTARKDWGIKSDFRKEYNLNRIPVIESSLQNIPVVRNFYYPEFDYEVY